MRYPLARFIGLAVVVLTSALALAEDASLQTLAEHLDRLTALGTRIIYTSDLVQPGMTLPADTPLEPTAEHLQDILEPFGLELRPGPRGSLIVVQGDAATAPENTSPSASREETVAVPIPEIIVTSSLRRIEYQSPATHTYLDNELSTRIPTTNDEPIRLTNRLPGTAGGTVSSRNHVRGGDAGEVLFLLDGLRLYEPYHLKDFQAVATLVNSHIIGGLDFYSGGFPARFGDKMSSVASFDLRPAPANGATQTELGLSFLNTSAVSSGSFGADNRGSWLISARRGNLDLVLDAGEEERGRPVYQDYLARVGWDVGQGSNVDATVLFGKDKISLLDAGAGESADASYSNLTFWLGWEAQWSEALSSDTRLAYGEISNRRQGVLQAPSLASGTLREDESFSTLEFDQDWRLVLGDKRMLRAGVNARRVRSRYNFASTRSLAQAYADVFNTTALTGTDASIAPTGAQFSGYLELRSKLHTAWTLDLGVRWDRQTYATADNDSQVSPRVSVLFDVSRHTTLRFGWGRFAQAQEINELQLSDGIDTFFPAQRSEHFIASLERAWVGGTRMTLAAYYKRYPTLRPRFENALNTLTLLPELQFDRVRVDAQSARSRGVELTLGSGRADSPLLWWLSYSWSRVEDQTAEGWVLRSWDQTHSAKAGMSWSWRAWQFTAAGEYHTGWPTTDVALPRLLDGADSAASPVFPAARNRARLAHFRSLDLRISRAFAVSRGELTGFLEITNALDTRNVCCREYTLGPDGEVNTRNGQWLSFLPSLGVLWKFGN